MQHPGRPTREARSREELARSVVARLREARESAGMTRRRLSELSGVSGHTIAKIEQAAVTDPGFAVVAAIAGALELPLDDLLRRARRTSGAGVRVRSS
ncbi:helix-turn-helix domain-containing protein [Occultella gossypii]|uniref:Helix-turn-helix transcriptional regulator n=1 Tax=Occultella gossypii TaxID=2800820 RepID=A0ABS7SGV6_9MICO|nr:helix-turn-helix transcriptional regulator [Occultella gossypii]